MELDSDVDIFVVRPSDAPASKGWDSDVRSLEVEATRWTGNDVRVLEMTETHVERHGADEPVLRDILSEGVRLAGDLEWLRRTVWTGQHLRFAADATPDANLRASRAP